MTGPPTIARLSGGGRIWALGALLGDDDALEALARAVLSRWRPGDRLVVRQAAHAGHAELLASLKRAALANDGGLLLSAAGVDATRPLDEQGDAFWWSAQSDATLAAALTGAPMPVGPPQRGWCAAQAPPPTPLPAMGRF
jgi:hypothetical protein